MLLPMKIGVSKYVEESTYMQEPLLELDKGKDQSNATRGYLELAEYIMAEEKNIYLNEYYNRKAVDKK